MCLLVYPKSEKQIALLTSLLEEMNIDFEKSQNVSYGISDAHKKMILERAKQYEENPNIGIPYEEVKKNIREKYGF